LTRRLRREAGILTFRPADFALVVGQEVVARMQQMLRVAHNTIARLRHKMTEPMTRERFRPGIPFRDPNAGMS